MTAEERNALTGYRWMESRIPALDGLVTFVPDAPKPEPVIEEMCHLIGRSRWYPVAGGHRLVMPFSGEEYDPARFSIEMGAWDHEDCDSCGERIPPMTLCHVTEPDEPYVLLCAACFGEFVEEPRER